MSQIIKPPSSSPPPPGFVLNLQGNTGGPVPPNGSGVVFVQGDGSTATVAGNPGTNTLTISVINDSFKWFTTTSNFNIQPQQGVFCSAGVTVNLPATAGLSLGATVIIYADTFSSVVIQANTGQEIQVGNDFSSTGGTATSTTAGCVLTLVFRPDEETWHTISNQATWTLA